MLTDCQRFKLGMLQACAEHGLNEDETLQVVKKATARLRTEKQAIFDKTVSNVVDKTWSLGSTAAKALAGGLLLGVPAVGALSGYALARGRGKLSDEDVAEAKKQELTAAYRHAAADLQRRRQLATRQQHSRRRPARALV